MKAETKQKLKRFAKLTAKAIVGGIGGLFGIVVLPITFIPHLIYALLTRIGEGWMQQPARPVWMSIALAFKDALFNIPVAFFKDSWNYVYPSEKWTKTSAGPSPHEGTEGEYYPYAPTADPGTYSQPPSYQSGYPGPASSYSVDPMGGIFPAVREVLSAPLVRTVVTEAAHLVASTASEVAYIANSGSQRGSHRPTLNHRGGRRGDWD